MQIEGAFAEEFGGLWPLRWRRFRVEVGWIREAIRNFVFGRA